MATLVYNIPDTPTRENGAREDRFFKRQRGRSVVPVIPRRATVRVISIPVAVMKRAEDKEMIILLCQKCIFVVSTYKRQYIGKRSSLH